MPNLPMSVLLFAVAVFLVAGFVKGFLGMGLPTIATGLLTMVVAPAQAAALPLTSAAALSLALARAGALPVSVLLASLYALAPAGLGALFGQWLRLRTRPAVFMRAFAVGLLLIGMQLTVKSLI